MKSKGAESDFIKSNPCFIPVSVSFFLANDYNFNWHKYGLENTGKGQEKMIDLNNIARQSLKIAEHRKLETDALSCIKHCAGEIAEATQAIDNYQSCVCEETEKQMADEISDVIMCMLTLSAEMGINIEQAILNCLEKNRKRARAKYEADKNN